MGAPRDSGRKGGQDDTDGTRVGTGTKRARTQDIFRASLLKNVGDPPGHAAQRENVARRTLRQVQRRGEGYCTNIYRARSFAASVLHRTDQGKNLLRALRAAKRLRVRLKAMRCGDHLPGTADATEAADGFASRARPATVASASSGPESRAATLPRDRTHRRARGRKNAETADNKHA